MKKFVVLLFAIALLLTSVGCGYTNSKVREADNKLGDALNDYVNGNSDSNELNDAINEYSNAISGNVKGFDDINKYIKANIESEEYQSTLVTLREQGLELSLFADGNNLIYRYTFIVPVADNAAEIIEQNFKDTEEMLESTADTIRIEAPCVEKVCWQYYSLDNELICSIEK